jgi:small subunit ribosomal protein S6
MRIYEELFVIKPDTPEEEVDAYIGQVKDLITGGQGTIDKVDKWGVRKLAYRVSKYNEGIYVLVQFSSSPELVHEVERRMRVTDMVIKFITVRIDEKLKKIEKRKKHRVKRAARRPSPPPSAPAHPAEPAAGGPGLPGMGLPGAPVPIPALPVPGGPAPGVPESPAAVTAAIEHKAAASVAAEPATSETKAPETKE